MKKNADPSPIQQTAYELHRHQVFMDPAFKHHIELLLEAANHEQVTSETVRELTNLVAKNHRIAYDDLLQYIENGLIEPPLASKNRVRLLIGPKNRTFMISFGLDATEVEVREQFKTFRDYRDKYAGPFRRSRRDVAVREPAFLHALRKMRKNKKSWKEIERAYEAGELPPTKTTYYGKEDLMRYYYDHPYPDIPQ